MYIIPDMDLSEIGIDSLGLAAFIGALRAHMVKMRDLLRGGLAEHNLNAVRTLRPWQFHGMRDLGDLVETLAGRA